VFGSWTYGFKNNTEMMIETPVAKVNPISHQAAPSPEVRCLAELVPARTS
jgi:hypothetical protein